MLFRSTETIRALIIEALIKSRARILNPQLDIIIPPDESSNDPNKHNGLCIIFLDGFNITIENTIRRDDQIEQPEAKEETGPEVTPEPSDWVCLRCTFLNLEKNNHCEMCDAAIPAIPAPPTKLTTAVITEVK